MENRAGQVPGNRQSLDWVLIAKGIGIILVVAGHFYPETSPPYWVTMGNVLYSFHMPLFFILSGYLYGHGKYPYPTLMAAKTRRLLFPFVSIAAAFFLIKYIAGQFVHLTYPANIEGIFVLLTNPGASYMPLLWYLHALFLIFVVYPPARAHLDNLLLGLIFLIINTTLGNDYLVFGKAMAHMPFFIAGVALKERNDISKRLKGADLPHVLCPFILFCLTYVASPPSDMHAAHEYPVRFILGLTGSLFVINLSEAISANSRGTLKHVLLSVGNYSMSIYLFHTLFESPVIIVALQIFQRLRIPFELLASGAIMCGVLFPLVLEKEVLRKYSATRKFILGLS